MYNVYCIYYSVHCRPYAVYTIFTMYTVYTIVYTVQANHASVDVFARFGSPTSAFTIEVTVAMESTSFGQSDQQEVVSRLVGPLGDTLKVVHCRGRGEEVERKYVWS